MVQAYVSKHDILNLAWCMCVSARVCTEFKTTIAVFWSLALRSHLWFAGVCECLPLCSIGGVTVTVHLFFCIWHLKRRLFLPLRAIFRNLGISFASERGFKYRINQYIFILYKLIIRFACCYYSWTFTIKTTYKDYYLKPLYSIWFVMLQSLYLLVYTCKDVYANKRTLLEEK